MGKGKKINHEVREFGGKRYQFLAYKHTKADAKKLAESQRKKAKRLARVVPHKMGKKQYYDVYVRPKK